MRRSCLTAVIVLTSLLSSTSFGSVWPMEKFDRWGTNRAPSGPASADLYHGYLYRMYSPGILVSGGPALGDDGIGYFGNWQDHLVYKFNWRTGEVLTSFNGLNFMTSSPAIGNFGDVYISSDNPAIGQGGGQTFKLFSSNFDYDWAYPSGVMRLTDFQHPSPILGPDGDIMVASGNLGAARIRRLTGNALWTRGNIGGGYRTIVFGRDDIDVYFAHSNHLTALNYTIGATHWDRDLGATVGAPGVAQDGQIIVGTGDNSGNIFSLNPVTGATNWSKATLSPVVAAPAFSADGTTVYITCMDQRLYSHRLSDGLRNWSFTSDGQCFEAPLVGADGHIYFITRGGHLYSVTPGGSQLWSLSLNAECRGSMSMDDLGNIYVGMAGAGGRDGLGVISQRIVSLAPATVTVTSGSLFRGALSDVLTSDDHRISIFDNVNSLRGSIEFSANAGLMRSAFEMKFEVEASASRPGLDQEISFYSYNSGSFDVKGAGEATLSDSLSQVVVNATTQAFFNQSNGQVRAAVTWTPINDETPSQDGWLMSVDYVHWTLTP